MLAVDGAVLGGDPVNTLQLISDCYGCSLTERRWLCPFHRRLYTFGGDGQLQRRKPMQPSVFELKTVCLLGGTVPGNPTLERL